MVVAKVVSTICLLCNIATISNFTDRAHRIHRVQLGRYGIVVGEPSLDYERLLSRVREVVNQLAGGGDPSVSH